MEVREASVAYDGLIEAAADKVPAGYKRTEVGVIPEDWRGSLLYQRSKQITDGEHLTPIRSETGHFLLSARNIRNGRLDLSDVDFVGEAEYRRIKSRCNPAAGDVLISCSGTIGRVAVVPKGFECVLVRSVALVKPDPEVMSGRFVQYFLQSSAGQKQIFASLNQGAQANLFQNHIRAIRVPFPPTKTEQESIAEALSDADTLIESLEQLLAKKRQIKQGTMQQLLTGKKRLPGFTGDWTLGRLKDAGSTYGGLTGKSKADFGDGTARYITFMNIMTNVVIDCTSFENVKVLPTESQNRVRKGDLFFNGSSETPEEVGMCSILAEEVENVYLNSFCFGFRYRDQKVSDGKYLAYYFRSSAGRELLKSLAQGATGHLEKPRPCR